jgi:hypothetical protein
MVQNFGSDGEAAVAVVATKASPKAHTKWKPVSRASQSGSLSLVLLVVLL